MSATSFSFHPAAIEEAISATRRYRERNRMAATNFVAELNEAIDRILEARIAGRFLRAAHVNSNSPVFRSCEFIGKWMDPF